MRASLYTYRWILTFAVAFAACFSWLAGCASIQNDAGDAASQIRNAVIQTDKNQFISFFENTSDLSESDFVYYFGTTAKPSALRKFMSKPNIKSHVFARMDDDGQEIVTVVYFDADVVQKPTALDWSKIGDGWLEKYAAVDLVRVSGKWYFDKTPFFFFRHAPWAGDYG